MLEVVAASIGGGRIRVCEIDGLPANFEGDYPTLIVRNIDQARTCDGGYGNAWS